MRQSSQDDGKYLGRLVSPRALTFAKARRPDLLDELEALAGKMQKPIAEAMLDAFAAQEGALDEAALIKALESGDAGRVLALLGLPEVSIPRLQQSLENTVWASGAATAVAINTQLSGVTFAFDRLNPKLIQWLQTYRLDLIKQIDANTREAVRQVLTDGMVAGKNPRDVARGVRQVVGLTDRQAKAVLNFRKELETFHLKRGAKGWNLGGAIDRAPGGAQVYRPDEDGLPMDGILERRLRDLRYDGTLKRAMATGKPLTPAQIDKMVDAYRRKYLKHRAETIARTEALRTTNVGVQDAWRQAIEKGKVSEELVRRRWIVARDERLCEICAPIPALNPKTGVKFAQPFATPKGPQMLPPSHPGCRCTTWIRLFEPSQLKD